MKDEMAKADRKALRRLENRDFETYEALDGAETDATFLCIIRSQTDGEPPTGAINVPPGGADDH